MNNQAYEAFNRLAMKLHQTEGTQGPATADEVAQIAAEYVNALVDRLTDEDLIRAIDEFRAGQTRMKQVAQSVQEWLESAAGHQRETEFKEFIAQLNTRMGNAA